MSDDPAFGASSIGRPLSRPEPEPTASRRGALGEGAPRQVVRSAEQVQLELPVAGPATRILAYGIDYGVIVLLQIGLLVLMFFGLAASPAFEAFLDGLTDDAEDLASGDPERFGRAAVLFVALFLLFQLVAEWGYFVVSEMAFGGRSLGKALVGLRVVRDGGAPLTLRASLARNLLRIADVLPTSYLVGLIAMVASREGKRFGDLAAGTIVIRLDAVDVAGPIDLREAVDPAEFRVDRSQLASLRPVDRTLIRQTLRRLDDLPPERQGEALARAVDVLSERLGTGDVPAERQRAFLEALHTALQQRR